LLHFAFLAFRIFIFIFIFYDFLFCSLYFVFCILYLKIAAENLAIIFNLHLLNFGNIVVFDLSIAILILKMKNSLEMIMIM